MKMSELFRKLYPLYLLIVVAVVAGTVIIGRFISVITEATDYAMYPTIIIDAGHGGIDGGAVSCTGILESKLNLDIALRLNDLLHLLGMKTKMIRTSDKSVHVQGNSISEIKTSDLKERVRIVNETEQAILISIHQNYFGDSRYDGAQVFYANNTQSEDLAESLQAQLIRTINKNSHRQAKVSKGVYLMEHVKCTAILVECGFLSNFEEEKKLNTPRYQQNLCCVIVATIASYFEMRV